MKLVFSTLLSIQIVAAPPILVTYRDHEIKANNIVRIITTKLGVPLKLVQVKKQESPCREDFDRILHVCVNQNNQLALAHQNKEVLQKSFQIFLR